MNNKIAQMLKQLKEKIVSQFGAGIVNIIVYGSYARGEESEEIIEKGSLHELY